tara:strand:- start:119 stop:568 length:450 start_codon:yes stop_codon:yes gene_type:complete
MSDKKKRTFFGNLWRGVVKNNIPMGETIVAAIDGGNPIEVIKAISKDKDIPAKDKEMMLADLQQDVAEMQEVTKRWESDNKSQDWLPSNIRPLSLAFLTLTLFIYIILDSSLDTFKIDQQWISLLGNLLMLVYGGYFGARTLEKIRKNK